MQWNLHAVFYDKAVIIELNWSCLSWYRPLIDNNSLLLRFWIGMSTRPIERVYLKQIYTFKGNWRESLNHLVTFRVFNNLRWHKLKTESVQLRVNSEPFYVNLYPHYLLTICLTICVCTMLNLRESFNLKPK